MILPLTTVAVDGYRSIRRIRLPVGHLTVLVGRNGVGKTNLYRALELLAAAARGGLTREIAEEGGIESVLWAGRRPRGKPVRLRLGAELGAEYGVEIGLPSPTEAAVGPTEPMVKAETLTHRHRRTAAILMKRQGPSAWLRDEDGRRQDYQGSLLASETALAGFQDAARYAELDLVRRAPPRLALLSCLPYRQSLTGSRPVAGRHRPDACLGRQQSGRLPCHRHEYPRRGEAIETAIRDAFPGACLDAVVEAGRIHLALRLADMPPSLAAHELSDGTLAYLCLVAALLSYRLPASSPSTSPKQTCMPT